MVIKLLKVRNSQLFHLKDEEEGQEGEIGIVR